MSTQALTQAAGSFAIGLGTSLVLAAAVAMWLLHDASTRARVVSRTATTGLGSVLVGSGMLIGAPRAWVRLSASVFCVVTVAVLVGRLIRWNDSHGEGSGGA